MKWRWVEVKETSQGIRWRGKVGCSPEGAERRRGIRVVIRGAREEEMERPVWP